MSTTTPPVGVQRRSRGAHDLAVGRRLRSRSSSASVRPESASASPCRWPPSSSAFRTARDAADAMQVDGEEASARLQVGDQRRAREHRGDVVEREADAGLVRDRRQVQAGVGRAAGGGDRGAGVLERLARHQVARQRPAVAHDLGRRAGRRGAPARAARCTTAGSIAEPGSARPSVSATIAIVLAVNWPGHEPSVGAQAWPSSSSSASVMRAGEHRADALVGGEDGDVLAAPVAGQHRAAVDEDARAG